MTQKDMDILYIAVKSDDLTSFCKLYDSDINILNISFGRFTLLSVCYLYGSKNIAKKFGAKLNNIEKFEVVNEPFRLYQDFKRKAEKNIKYYAGTNDFVTPIEMLAILHKDGLVKKQFKANKNSGISIDKLKKIYANYGQKCEIKDKKLSISAKKLTKTQKKAIILSNVILFSALISASLIITIISTFFGFGTISNPKKVHSAKQLFQIANNQNTSIRLMNDIVLKKEFASKKYSGTIFGNNKNIIIDYDIDNSLFEDFKGTIKDVNFVFNTKSISLYNSLGLICKENNGTIENVDISFNSNISFESENELSYFCGIAVNNIGKIKDCNLDMSITATNQNSIDAFTSFVAGHNFGEITNCNISKNSKIENLNVDASSIVIENHQQGFVSHCYNNAKINQNSDSSTWSPNVSGIAMTNYGKIENCINFGNLNINQTSETENNCAIVIGGICANNYSTIFHCKNKGDIEAFGLNTTIYSGGIVGFANNYSNTVYTTIDYCISECNINVNKTDAETYVYCGGIAGYMIGTLSNCCAVSTFANGFDKETNVMTALLIGASSGQVSFQQLPTGQFVEKSDLYLNIENVHILSNEKVLQPIAIAYISYRPLYVESLNADFTIYETIQNLKQCETFWENIQ